MGTPEVETLFARTLLGDYEGDDAWNAISALRQDGSRRSSNVQRVVHFGRSAEESASGSHFVPASTRTRDDPASRGTRVV